MPAVLYLRVLVEVAELLLLVGFLMMMMMILMRHKIRMVDMVHIFPRLLVLSNLSEPILEASW